MARTLLWNVQEQKDEGVFPDATAANTHRDRIIKQRKGIDTKQHGVKVLAAADFQNVSVN